MLERVMRRFGVTRQERALTYFDTLRHALSTKMGEQDSADSTASLIETTAREVYLLEPKASRGDLRDPADPESHEAYWQYLGLLRDNERLPRAGQLAEKELATVRKLLLGDSERSDAAKHAYDQALAQLETKFGAGDFPQAALLLRLFETTTARRRSNERTLFYEEMLARFGVPRVNRISSANCRRFQKTLAGSEVASENLVAAARWLAEHAGIRINVCFRHPEQLALWEKALDSTEDGDRDALLEVLVPVRWRGIEDLSGLTPLEAVKHHLKEGALSTYLDRLMRACYFIVVVTTKTGFEPFIRNYFEWVEQHFGFPGGRLLPQLHKKTTLDECGLDDTIKELRLEMFEEQSQELLESFDDESILAGFENLTTALKAIDPNDIPPGDYDLTGLLIDLITDLSCCDDPSVMFRVHRVC